MSNFILAEFKGTYRAPHPDGIKDQNILKRFHVKVKMKREVLKAPGLNGTFATYYKEILRVNYPDLIDTYEFDLVQATELDGKVIDNPRALSYDGLLAYIRDKSYPINSLLYSPNELRNEIILYEQDPAGQQHLEKLLQQRKGAMLATTAELRGIEDLMVVVDPSVQAVVPKQPEPAAPRKAAAGKSVMEAFVS